MISYFSSMITTRLMRLSWYATATGHSFASDVTTLGLDTAATAVGAAGIKTILTAISTGVGGQKIAVQRDFFQNQNVALIIKNMRAARAETLAKIRSKTSKSVDEYPLQDALLDLQEYFAAGTIIGGIQHASDTAALQKIIADEAAAQGERVKKLGTLRALKMLETRPSYNVKSATLSTAKCRHDRRNSIKSQIKAAKTTTN